MTTRTRAENVLRSTYGVKTYTAEQIKEQWRESIKAESWLRDHHIIKTCGKEELINKFNVDAASMNLDACDQEDISYFNNNKQYDTMSIYDRLHSLPDGYCSKLHRDDREHTRGLNMNDEEKNKAVPVLSSSAYGHRKPLETITRQHVRVGLVNRDFYRACGPNGHITDYT